MRFPDGGECTLYEVAVDELYPVSHNGSIDLPVSTITQPYFAGMHVGGPARQ